MRALLRWVLVATLTVLSISKASLFDQDITWLPLGSDIHGMSTSDELGKTVTLNGDGTVLAVGAPGSGYVKAYLWTTGNDGYGNWSQLGATIYGDIGDLSGTSIALDSSGQKLAVGAPGYNSTMGRARVYQWNSATLVWYT